MPTHGHYCILGDPCPANFGQLTKPLIPGLHHFFGDFRKISRLWSSFNLFFQLVPCHPDNSKTVLLFQKVWKYNYRLITC